MDKYEYVYTVVSHWITLITEYICRVKPIFNYDYELIYIYCLYSDGGYYALSHLVGSQLGNLQNARTHHYTHCCSQVHQGIALNLVKGEHWPIQLPHQNCTQIG